MSTKAARPSLAVSYGAWREQHGDDGALLWRVQRGLNTGAAVVGKVEDSAAPKLRFLATRLTSLRDCRLSPSQIPFS